eukprot:2055831-Prymnesium_polylepis.1
MVPQWVGSALGGIASPGVGAELDEIQSAHAREQSRPSWPPRAVRIDPPRADSEPVLLGQMLALSTAVARQRRHGQSVASRVHPLRSLLLVLWRHKSPRKLL